jgi:hypothetical protein
MSQRNDFEATKAKGKHINTLIIFDLDNTLIDTQAKAVLRCGDGTPICEYDTAQYNHDGEQVLLNKEAGEHWDFSQFNDLEILMNEPKLEAFRTLCSIVKYAGGIRGLHIITAREDAEMIQEWLRRNGIDLPLEHIHVRGNYKSTVDLKRETLDMLLTELTDDAWEDTDVYISEDEPRFALAMVEVAFKHNVHSVKIDIPQKD